MPSYEIRVNDPADGRWIMAQSGGNFNPGDCCLGLHRRGKLCGGGVFTGYMGASMLVHMAGDGSNWLTRDFIWMAFDYCFNQVGVRKLLGLIPSDNHRALDIALRLGFTIETGVRDVFPDGSDLLILVLDKPDAKWLYIKPRHLMVGSPLSTMAVH